jgi:hypothetical protein
LHVQQAFFPLLLGILSTDGTALLALGGRQKQTGGSRVKGMTGFKRKMAAHRNSALSINVINQPLSRC